MVSFMYKVPGIGKFVEKMHISSYWKAGRSREAERTH